MHPFHCPIYPLKISSIKDFNFVILLNETKKNKKNIKKNKSIQFFKQQLKMISIFILLFLFNHVYANIFPNITCDSYDPTADASYSNNDDLSLTWGTAYAMNGVLDMLEATNKECWAFHVKPTLKFCFVLVLVMCFFFSPHFSFSF